MDSFDQTFKKAKEIFDTAYQKTGEAINVQKLKMELSSVKNSLNKTFAALGKIWYETAEDRENLTEEVKSLFNDAKLKLEEVAALKSKISDLSGSKPCEKCGALNPKNAKFCNKCGEKIL